MNRKIAILIAEAFQDEEVAEPVTFFRSQGFEPVLIGLSTQLYHGKYGRHSYTANLDIDNAKVEDYAALLIPGGSAPERLRIEERVLKFVRDFALSGKPIGAICHGPQVLISAGLLNGRHITSYVGIRDDVKLAGADYEDAEVIIDGNLVTSRKPGDIPAFNEAILGIVGEGQ